MANGNCRKHFGKNVSGIGSPAFKHGRYSKVLPSDLKARYDAARADPDLLSLREEIALIESRLMAVLDGLNTGESQAAWATLANLWGPFARDLRDDSYDDLEALRARASAIEATLQRGLSEIYAWNDARSLIKQRMDLVSSERQRLIQMQQVVTVEQVMVLLSVVTDIVRRHVTDRPTLVALSTELTGLATRRAG